MNLRFTASFITLSTPLMASGQRGASERLVAHTLGRRFRHLYEGGVSFSTVHSRIHVVDRLAISLHEAVDRVLAFFQRLRLATITRMV